MRALTRPSFPRPEPAPIALFWARYWFWFLLLLPWMLLRQLFLSAHQLAGVLWTWNREVVLLDGDLRLLHLANPASAIATALFGERFVAIQYRDVAIDPGPPFARRRVERWLRTAPTIERVVVTHAHEEHTGNAPLVADARGAPIEATAFTLAALRDPERLSYARRRLMGQPEPATELDTREMGERVATPAGELVVVESPGHCEGHASVYCPERRMLFAGDSFLHTVFTAPNRDVSAADWIETLERYEQLDVRSMVGTHGDLVTSDPEIPDVRFVTRRGDPNAMIRDKLAFTRWAVDVVAEGERRGLPYSVIEACLFPWQRWWSWRNWFNDESWRLFSAGEFSRTHFVRSLSRTPERVPHRFPAFARLKQRVAQAVGR